MTRWLRRRDLRRATRRSISTCRRRNPQGVHVAINYRTDEASAKATLEKARAKGSDGFIVQADVSKPAQVERLFERVRDEFGSLDIFVNNARGEVDTLYESSPTPRKSRNANESAARQAMPRSASMPSISA